ncbi:hypothetical protein [Paraburkholderia mimosarum]|uniref:hypothetical protein n=1 Tax=Paraburkholderia mimosarum TaxID=312026 RepID=UPI0006861521|nr:hypothetical protein [Paraburkholderia mimosarum]
MKSDETPQCRCRQDLACAECECRFELPARGSQQARCARKHTIAESTEEKETDELARSLNCGRCLTGHFVEEDNAIASYVRARLRMMATDVFLVSRHTADFAARALQDRFLSDTDAMLKRILDLAALRYLKDGSTTITQEDVAVALRLVMHDSPLCMRRQSDGGCDPGQRTGSRLAIRPKP